MSEDILEEENLGLVEKQKSIVDHLQGPQIRKKNYVTLAFGSDVDSVVLEKIEYFINMKYEKLTVVKIKDLKELAKMYSRNILLLIISEKFAPLEKKIEIIKRFKLNHTETGMPVLFITGNSDRLLRFYNDNLLAYQEIDDYVESNMNTLALITNKVEQMLTKGSKRRSRRFPVPFRVSYFDLKSGKNYDGVIVDLSMHGALLQKHKKAPVFSLGDQIKVAIPLARRVDNLQGEKIYLSAKIRRVIIGGEKAGISWEYLSREKASDLLEYVTEVSNKHVEEQIWRRRAKLNVKRVRKSSSE